MIKLTCNFSAPFFRLIFMAAMYIVNFSFFMEACSAERMAGAIIDELIPLLESKGFDQAEFSRVIDNGRQTGSSTLSLMVRMPGISGFEQLNSIVGGFFQSRNEKNRESYYFPTVLKLYKLK